MLRFHLANMGKFFIGSTNGERLKGHFLIITKMNKILDPGTYKVNLPGNIKKPRLPKLTDVHTSTYQKVIP